MRIDLNSIVQKFKPWDFAIDNIEGDGKSYPTKPWQVEHRARLEAAQTRDDFVKLLRDLLPAEAPIESWQTETLGHVIAAIQGYKEALSRKNAGGIATKIAMQVQTEAATQNS